MTIAPISSSAEHIFAAPAIEEAIKTDKAEASSLVPVAERTEAVRLSAPIQGFTAYSLKEQYAFTRWLEKLKTVYESFGFAPIHLRPLERLSALRGETDNQKQIFGVYRTDGNLMTELAIPFDHTVPLALFVAEQGHHKQLELPYKRYDLGLSFRGERPQVGRFRAFVQADIDVVGRKLGLAADAECLCALIKGLEDLDAGEFCVSINHIDIVKGIIQASGIPENFHPQVLRVIDKLDKRTPEEVVQEILQIPELPVSEEQVQALVARFNTKCASLDDFSFEEDYGPAADKGLADLREVTVLLQKMGIDPSAFQFDLRMVRGLDYYTGLVFETFLNGKEQYGSVMSGGRYSNLVGRFAEGLEDVEGVGGSIGLTRLFEIAGENSLSKRITTADVLVGYRTEAQQRFAFEIATHLRDYGFKVNVYAGEPNVKKCIAHADGLGVPFSVIAMDTNAVVVKDMNAFGGKTKAREPDLTSKEAVLDKLLSLRSRV